MDGINDYSASTGLITIIVILATASKGSACEMVSGPQCFRRTSSDSVYTCEWSKLRTTSNVTYILYIENADMGPYVVLGENSYTIPDEALIKARDISIWVNATLNTSSCQSPITTVTLKDTVKYVAPQNIIMSWLQTNLTLSWTAAETYPALVELKYMRLDYTTDSWENISIRTKPADESFKYKVSLDNLQRSSAHLLQIRQKSTQVSNSMWSDWSPVESVPAEIEQPAEVNTTIMPFKNGTRLITITWKGVSRAASEGGVTYLLSDSQLTRHCPCRKQYSCQATVSSECHMFVTNSSVNISVTASNSAGSSHPTYVHVEAETATNLKPCDNPITKGKIPQKTCFEWYNVLQDGPHKVNTLKSGEKYETMTNKMEDYVRYYFIEHQCVQGIPQTVQMCLFYKKEGAPQIKPQDVHTEIITHDSVMVYWKPIPVKDQRGFLTHYAICIVQEEDNLHSNRNQNSCHNVSGLSTEYLLKNLKPGAIYNITVAGVTVAGEGPKAIYIHKTEPVNTVWISLAMLCAFLFTSIMCTFILPQFKRIKNKICPPVLMPVILGPATYPLDNQEMLEIKEEVHKLTLHRPQLPCKDMDDTTVLGEDCETTDHSIEDLEDAGMIGGSSVQEGTCDDTFSPDYKSQVLVHSKDLEMTDLRPGDSEITILMYRNGLVFDMRTYSTEDVRLQMLETSMSAL